MPDNAFLITGANAGLGKDVARQLALRADVDSVYPACRHPYDAIHRFLDKGQGSVMPG